MKKITAALLAVALIILTCAVPAFAEDVTSGNMTDQEFEEQYYSLLGAYLNGELSWEEYNTSSNAIIDDYYNDTAGGEVANRAAKIGRTAQAVNNKIGDYAEKYGDAALDNIKFHLQNPLYPFYYTEKVKTSSSTTGIDVPEGGAGIIVYYYNSPLASQQGQRQVYISSKPGCTFLNGGIINANLYDYSYTFTDKYGTSTGSGTATTLIPGDNGVCTITLFGTWLNEDGTPSDFETGDTYDTISKYDFTQKINPDGLVNPDDLSDPDNYVDTTEQDLIDLLDDILTALETELPDLDTTEGTLKAIYNRLGQLDSDDDNEKLDLINQSILSLLQGGEDNEKAIDVLIDMRDYLMNGMNGNSGDEHEIAGTLYNVKPLEKSWLNSVTHDKTQLKVEYEGKTYYLEDDGCLQIDGKYYHVDLNYDAYSTVDYDFGNTEINIDRKYVDVDFDNYNAMWNGLTKGQQDKLDDVVTLISKLLAQGVPYSAVTGGLDFYQDIIFNSHDPEDIVLNLTYNGVEYEITILSTSFFGDKGAQALQIVKSFVMIVICYLWLLSMRRKTSSMMG